MGCDIHIYLEKRNKDEDRWESADFYTRNTHYTGWDYEPKYRIIPIYRERNYDLFSILAGVRNYNNVKPISSPRGIPNDCCPEIMQEYKNWGDDGHSHSYITLRELLDYQSKKIPIKRAGYLTKENIELLDKGESPRWWKEYPFDSENCEYREWLDCNDYLKPIINKIYERAKECYMWFWMDELVTEDSDNIRIVFWFDN